MYADDRDISVKDERHKLDGRGAQIRTGDPLVPNQVRYQTALHPDPRITRVFWLFKQAFKITKLELSGYLWKIIPTQIPFHLVRS